MAAPPEDEKWYCPLCLLKNDKTKKGTELEEKLEFNKEYCYL